MIKIDSETKKIFFFYSPEELKINGKHDENMYDFDLLSGFICPECKRVIDAYYVGILPIKESDGWRNHPYLPKNNGYCVTNPHYSFGHKYGGGYIGLCNHNDITCKIKIAGTVGIMEGIKNFISWIIPTPEIVPSDFMIKKFANDILENKIPGVFLIEDVCKQRSPILAINRKEFAKGIEYPGYSEFDKEYKYELLLYKLIIKDQDVKIIGVE
jgi:hypothetical protein